ncbi:MFS transporter [Rhodococcus sp. NPDC019627]|uniref:MFS transporter n=1 Tax=unclassified Rhodococcus (in: high G+C Gram-positive bacteria) TaxID=192944 RepID=UPI003403AE74
MSSTSDSQSVPTTEATEWRRGGRTVASAFVGYGSASVLFLITASVFVKPTMQATGWSTSEVLVSPIVLMLLTACGPLAGRASDRWGARRTISTGVVAYAVLLILFATLPVSKLTFYGLAVGIGIMGSFAYMVPFNRAVTVWFDKGAGKAFGLVGTGSAVMPLIAIPLVTVVIYSAGWQAGYLVLAGFALLISLPAVIFGIQERPRDREQDFSTVSDEASADALESEASVKQVLRTPRYWIFSFSIVAVTAATSAYLANLQPILLDGGASLAVATTMTTLYSVGTIIGRLSAGTLLDLFPRRKIAVAVSFLLIAALGSLAMTAVGTLPVFLTAVAVMLVASSQGAEADFGAYFLLKEYGRRNFGTLYATALAFSGVSGVAFPYVFSFVRDSTGSYMWATAIGAASLVIAALSILVFGLTAPRGHRTSRRDPSTSAQKEATPA